MSSKSYVVNSGQLFFHQTLRKRIEARTSHQFEHTVYKQLRTKGQCRLFICFVYVGSLATLFFLTQESILLSLENLPEGCVAGPTFTASELQRCLLCDQIQKTFTKLSQYLYVVGAGLAQLVHLELESPAYSSQLPANLRETRADPPGHTVQESL